MECDECGGTYEVLEITVWWTAWGRNCFDFNWSKNTGSMKLCEDCESEHWVMCGRCNAFIDSNYVGGGYISDDPDHDYLCPDCAERMDNLFPMAQRLRDFLRDNLIDKEWVNIGGNWHPMLIR